MQDIDYSWLRIIPLLNSTEGQSVTAAQCEESKLESDDFYRLVEAEIENMRCNRRNGLFETFDEVFLRDYDDVAKAN